MRGRISWHGHSGDTAQSSCAPILPWWQHLGHGRFSNARRLVIAAESGTSNSPRTCPLRVALKKCADGTGLQIEPWHFAPPTSKRTKIERRVFSFTICINWCGRPLSSYEVIVDLIPSSTTSVGLKVYVRPDQKTCPTKLTITDHRLAAVNIRRHDSHPERNYRITPTTISP